MLAAAGTIGGPVRPAAYVLQPGETLASIAAANGSTTQALIDANGLADPDLIRVGQVLIIPRATTAPAGFGTI